MAFGDAILLAIVASFFLFMAVEWLAPSGRAMPAVRHWRLIGVAGFAVTMAVAVGAPLLIVPYLPAEHERWSTCPAGAAGRSCRCGC